MQKNVLPVLGTVAFTLLATGLTVVFITYEGKHCYERVVPADAEGARMELLKDEPHVCYLKQGRFTKWLVCEPLWKEDKCSH